MRVLNDTPMPHQTFLWRDASARRYCSIIVKVTCRLSDGTVSTAQDPLVMADLRGPNGTIERPSDVAPIRTGTSVVVRGTVYARPDTGAREGAARVRVGPLVKELRAFGKRTWLKRGGEYVPSEPEPFEAVPATLSNAFGGGPPGAFKANPAGLGYVATDEERPTGKPIPQLEDPKAPIRSPDDRPIPAALDAIPGSFSPRLELSGTYDEKWKREQAPLPPHDLDHRAFDVGQPGLIARPFLRGREDVELAGLHPHGPIRCSLPRPPLRIDVASSREFPFLDLVVLEPATDRVTLTFRRTYEVTALGLSYPRVTVHLLERVAPGARHG